MNQTVPSQPPPLAPISEKTGMIGTLVYTSGGLVVLFFWLLMRRTTAPMTNRIVQAVSVTRYDAR